jgi:prevent-host-death family protein
MAWHGISLVYATGSCCISPNHGISSLSQLNWNKTMRTVGAFEAKNTLGTLLDLVEQGEEVIITRHGKPAARLVAPVNDDDRVAKARAAAVRIRERAKGVTLGGLSIKELIEDGRR